MLHLGIPYMYFSGPLAADPGRPVSCLPMAVSESPQGPLPTISKSEFAPLSYPTPLPSPLGHVVYEVAHELGTYLLGATASGQSAQAKS